MWWRHGIPLQRLRSATAILCITTICTRALNKKFGIATGDRSYDLLQNPKQVKNLIGEWVRWSSVSESQSFHKGQSWYSDMITRVKK